MQHFFSSPASLARGLCLASLVSLGWLGGTAATAATVELYLSPPTEQTTTRPNTTVETFNARAIGSIGANGTWDVGPYTASTGSVAAANVYGGASASLFLNVQNGPITVTLNGDRRYVGFWWSAGDATNGITFFDANNNQLAAFTTASLVTILSGSTTITATDGQQYATAAYYGNPNAAFNVGSNRGNNAEPYGYINLVISGTTSTFKTIRITGSNFELDNIAIADNVVIDPRWVNYGSVPVVAPAGEISLTRDRTTTAYSQAVSGSVATNDSVPTGSTFSAVGTPANGTIAIDASGAFTYTPNPGFSGIDNVDYRACKPAPDATSCATTTLTIAVGPRASPDTFSTLPGVATSGTSVAANDQAAAGSTYQRTSLPASGTVTMATNGSFVYTPNPGFTGSDTFNYQVCLPAPDAALCSTSSVTVNVALAAPPAGTGVVGVPVFSPWSLAGLTALLGMAAWRLRRRLDA